MRRLALPLVVAALSVGAANGCKCAGSDGPSPASSASAKGRAPLAPLSEPSWLVELPVEGFGAARVAVPLGATEPRPIVIALHGGADRPEWACGTWVGVSRSHPFVLCPRGVEVKGHADPPRYGWASSEQTAKELRAALKALKARYAAHVAPGSVVLAAFGAGTRPAVDILRSEASFFSRVVLVAPEPDIWSAGHAGVFAQAGGRYLLLVCSDPACRPHAQRYFMFSRGAGTATKLLDLPSYGAVLDARVARAIYDEMPWLLTADDRYPRPLPTRSPSSTPPPSSAAALPPGSVAAPPSASPVAPSSAAEQ